MLDKPAAMLLVCGGVTYEWPATWEGYSVTRKGRDFWSGGEKAWRALEPGSSSVKIAWVPTEDGKAPTAACTSRASPACLGRA